MNPRYRALEQIQNREPVKPLDKIPKPTEIFGKNVFSTQAMKHYLSKEVFLELKSSIDEGKTLNRSIAGPVANAMKAWAMDQGATHYTHWFQPLTGRTAEKHDSFLELSGAEAINKFSGDELSQQEPDASSFPSGGLRATFEARGYTAWDCSSPAFIFDTTYGKTLCIPTIFVSYTGEALDYKIPLLKSMALLDKAAVDVCHYFDPDVKRVQATLGVEQEYFLIDEAYAELRPDLMLCGRTLFGAPSARGHQLDDHYFGSIPERIFAFMNQLEREAHCHGIPLRTRHNEVAPSQFECAPQFENLNVAIDHSLLIFDLIDRVARKHKLRALLHEKPFALINGSGKHNNWSMGTDNGRNLLSPGKNPQENLMFLTFFVTVIKAVYEYADLLRASIATAGNDHRLGANEAPPAIISVFIGHQLSKILDDIEHPPRRKRNEDTSELMHLGIAEIPELLLDNTDRNRTSPFAFTGNKFEFRAVGSSANSSAPMGILNLIVARQLTDFKEKVDAKIRRGRKKELAILDVIRDYIKTSKAVRFEGDGYSDDWVKEAKKRGLSNIKNTPHALDALVSDKAIEIFTTSGVFTEAELHARHEVLLENYLNEVNIEADLVDEMATTQILPVVLRYQRDLVKGLVSAKEAGLGADALGGQPELAREVGKLAGKLQVEVQKMREIRDKASKKSKVDQVAKVYADKVMPQTEVIRDIADQLEFMVPDADWPLPKYREMLFIR